MRAFWTHARAWLTAPRAAALLFAGTWAGHARWSVGAFAYHTPDLNDDVLHLRLVRLAAEAWRDGRDPTDVWLPTITTGFALFHHYQHLPHVVLGGLVALFDLDALYVLRAAELGLALALPVVLAACARGLGTSAVGAAWTGILTVLVASPGLYGLDPSSYGWAGPALTTQQFGVVLLAPAWVALLRARRGEDAPIWAGLGLGLLGLTHALLGWVAAMTAVVGFAAGPWRELPKRGVRLAGVGLIALALSAYFVVPFLLDRPAMNRSVWEPAHKYDSLGATAVLGHLVRGELFDGASPNRIPLVSLCVLLGAVLALLGRGGPERQGLRRAGWFGLGWLLLYFGRPTWGGLLEVLPGAGDLHLHRLVVPVQLAGLFLAGGGAAALWRVAWARLSAAPTLILALALLALPLLERAQFYAGREAIRDATAAAFVRDAGQGLAALEVAAAGPGRVYAGRAPNWGGEYRIGSVPMYALLTAWGVDNLGYLYHALAPMAEVEGYFDDRRSSHYNLFDITRELCPATLARAPFGRAEGVWDGHAVWRYSSSGAFDLVDVTEAYTGSRDAWREATVRWLASNDVERKRHPLVHPTTGQPWESWQADPGPDPPACGTLGPTRRAPEVPPDVYEVEVRTARACHALFKMTSHPGWELRVDGVPQPVLTVAPYFMAVAVPPGVHQVRATYAPPPWRSALRWTGLAVALGVAGVWAAAARRASRKPAMLDSAAGDG